MLFLHQIKRLTNCLTNGIKVAFCSSILCYNTNFCAAVQTLCARAQTRAEKNWPLRYTIKTFDRLLHCQTSFEKVRLTKHNLLFISYKFVKGFFVITFLLLVFRAETFMIYVNVFSSPELMLRVSYCDHTPFAVHIFKRHLWNFWLVSIQTLSEASVYRENKKLLKVTG